MTTVADDFMTDVIRDIAELPDRTSPPDAPDMMLVTAEELRAILTNRFMALGLKLAQPDQLHQA